MSKKHDQLKQVKLSAENFQSLTELANTLPVPPPLVGLVNAAIKRGLPLLAKEFAEKRTN